MKKNIEYFESTFFIIYMNCNEKGTILHYSIQSFFGTVVRTVYTARV
jgi:hypothetical protein